MRLGINPAKLKSQLPSYLAHRLIIPVHIPAHEGYFSQSLDILRLCLESVRQTVGGNAAVTLISNGSTPAVVAELERHHAAGWVDQLIINHTNRGKVDVVAAVARGAFEEFLTVADCDVLFRRGWLEAVEAMFARFPECGFVAPVPNPLLLWHHTSATVLGALAHRELGFARVIAEDDWQRFTRSIERLDLATGPHCRTQLTVQRGGTIACVGAGHFVFTMRKSVVGGMPLEPSLNAISGDSELRWLDMPADKLGFWRLATPQAYAYHMGNQIEPWMQNELHTTDPVAPVAAPSQPLPYKRPWISQWPWPVRRGLVRLLRLPVNRPLLRRILDLPADAAGLL
ncbi:MAG: glycosyltransferase family 2 protein [Chloroflexota bacterium]|nr:glycosyltransferase family 2 protein [Chloroflexota bacterium]